MATQQQQNISNEDPAVNKVYASSFADIPVTTGNTSIYITNLTEYTNIRVSGPAEPAGNTSEVQFNTNGQMDGDDGLTYNPTTDSLTVIGNLTSGAVFTNSLKYANGTNWSFAGTYTNSNVAAYLPTYTGNIAAGNITTTSNVTASYFIGNGSSLANITGSNVTGTVANATNSTNATFAATVTTAAQPNITSVGTLNGIVATGILNLTGASNVSLGPVANVRITGGVSGQVLRATSTNGVIEWATPTTGTLQDVTTNGATTSVAVSITNATATTSTTTGALKVTGGIASGDGISIGGIANISNTTASDGYSSGALKVSGGVGVGGNLNTFGHISTTETVFSGNLSAYNTLQTPKFVGLDTNQSYIQGALKNITETGSADWVAYGDLSDDANGWMDMGFTGSGFNDTSYTITKESDGYIICQGMPNVNGSPQGGNLVIATGEKGANADIVFAVGGFLAADEVARIDHDDLTFYVGGHAYGSTSGNPTPKVVSLDVNGNITVGGNVSFNSDTTVTGNLTVTKMMVTVTNTLGNLTATAGARAFISDANLVALGNFGAQIGSGGSNLVPAWSDGTNWYVG